MSAILALETGQVFHGSSVGVPGIRVGEVVFNTALTGYQEILTDPSYTQQLIAFTCPHIGNTGINIEDYQGSQIYASGVIIKSLSTYVSNWRANTNLQAYMQQQGTVAIADIDTRSLTKILRTHGALRGCIMTEEIDAQQAIKAAKQFPGLQGIDLTNIVSTRSAYVVNNKAEMHVVLIDFGVKRSIVQILADLNCKVTVVPAKAAVEDILSLEPDGILLANGPGDPSACVALIENVRLLLSTGLPIFGICLGHQLLALALGAKTYKMNFGHHGANHPVQNVLNKKVLITSQNHGFAVQEASLGADLEVSYVSLFDGSLQGFRHKKRPIFGFQGHPESAPGPHDAVVVFEEFINAVRVSHAKKK